MCFSNDCEVSYEIEEVLENALRIVCKVVCMPLVLAKMNDVMNLSI